MGLRIYNKLLNAGVETAASDPVSGLFTGRLYYNTATGELNVYNGSAWAAINDLIPNVYFNKFVGAGAGYYANLVTAMATAAAGDHFLVTDDTTETGDVTVPANVRITYMPNVVTTFTGANNFIMGALSELCNVRAQWTGASAQTRLVQITGADVRVDGRFTWNRAATLTTVAQISGSRAYVRLGVAKAAGTITDPHLDTSNSSSVEVWGA
jgi:hypothetical protein